MTVRLAAADGASVTFGVWWSGIAVVLAAAISATLALMAVQHQARSERRRLQHDRRSERLAHFFAATHAAVLGISELALTPMDDMERIDAALTATTVDRVNTRLAELRVLEPRVVVDSARALDTALVALHKKALAREWDRNAWRTERQKLTMIADSYVATVRRELKSDALPASADSIPIPE